MLNLDDLLKGDFSSSEEQDALKEKLGEFKIKEIEEEASSQARDLGVPYINLNDFPISPEALRIIPEEEARNYSLVCFYRTEKIAKIASPRVQNPSLAEYREQLEGAHGLKTELYLISETSLNKALSRYAILPKIVTQSKGVEISPQELKKFQEEIKTFKDLNQKVKQVKVSDLITLLMASAVQSDASDIHIETEETEVKVRFRIDGILIDVAEIDKKNWRQIVSRLKLLSGLKMNITDRPQDGRFTIYLEGNKTDVRVSCLPTTYGESVVMRLLRSSATNLNFKALGLRPEVFEKLDKEASRPNGMIITTGPTGSGKTTTLYAILNKLNNPETKIITLEDPIEYRLKGINQSQVDKSKDYSFAKGLRSILRQDPDVVMVGEIRDLETVEIAVQAALTGHLVVSTLHTNDAAGALPRLLSMGVKPFLLAPAINAIIGQRLVRKICENCKKEIEIEPAQKERVEKILAQTPSQAGIKIDSSNLKFYQGEGCKQCQGLGYKGRIGIYEVFIVDSKIEKAILEEKISIQRIKELTQEQGMITMVQDGVLKALEGITSLEEVFRVAE